MFCPSPPLFFHKRKKKKKKKSKTTKETEQASTGQNRIDLLKFAIYMGLMDHVHHTIIVITVIIIIIIMYERCVWRPPELGNSGEIQKNWRINEWKQAKPKNQRIKKTRKKPEKRRRKRQKVETKTKPKTNEMLCCVVFCCIVFDCGRLAKQLPPPPLLN